MVTSALLVAANTLIYTENILKECCEFTGARCGEDLAEKKNKYRKSSS